MVIISTAIGVAFKALAKVKKPVWLAMKGAMQSSKNAATSFEGMFKIFMFLRPIMKVIGMLFTLLGAAITRATMPAIKSLIKILTNPDFIEKIIALGTKIGELIVTLMTPEFLTSIGDLILSIINLAAAFLTPGFIAAVTGLISGLVILATVLLKAIKPALDWIATLSPSEMARLFYIVGLMIATLYGFSTAGWIGALVAAGAWAVGMAGLLSYQKGTPYVPSTGPYILHKGEAVLTKKENRRGSGDTHVHIDLRGAVIGDLDRFSRSILEQVMMRIG